MNKNPDVGGFMITGNGADIARAVFGPDRRNPEQAHITALRQARTLTQLHSHMAKAFPGQGPERQAKAAAERTLAREAIGAIRKMRARAS